MKNYLKLKSILVVFFFTMIAVSCSSDDGDGGGGVPPIDPPAEAMTITELAIDNENLSSLVAALQAADGDLPAVLNGTGPFTVFAPTNAAFDAFLNGSQLSDIPTDVLMQVLLNHVLAGENISTGLSTGYVNSMSTAGIAGNALSLFVDTSNGVSLNGVSNVTTPDVDATNGVVHIVDAVIGLPTISDHVLANGDFSQLAATMGDATPDTDFFEILSGDGPYTLFAPNNAAANAFNNPNEVDLADVIFNHVILDNASFASDLSTGFLTTGALASNDRPLNLFVNTADNGVLLNGSSSVVSSDIVATNGVIHVVDSVLDLPTIATFAAANPNFSIMFTALTEGTPATDFEPLMTIEEGRSYTVFAPVNAAFQAVLDSNDDFTTITDVPEDLLTGLLLYHAAMGTLLSTDLPAGTVVNPLLPDSSFTITEGTGDNIAEITDGTGNMGIGIVVVDVQAANGVVHAVDTVLMPNLQ